MGVPLSNRPLLVRDHEADCARLIATYRHGFFPRPGFREQWALDAAFGENVVGVFLAEQIPAFMPGHDLVGSRRHVGELEIPALVRHGIVGMRDHHHLGVHPDVAAVAAKVNEAARGHGTRGYAVREGEWQVERGRALHVDGVQGRVGTHHAEGGVLWHQQNVRDVAALFLVEVAPLFRQLQSFAAGDVFQVDDRVSYAALRPNDEALQVSSLSRVGIADFRVLGNGEGQSVGHRPGPLHGAGNRAPVSDCNDFVVALRERHSAGGKEECKEQRTWNNSAHTRPLDAPGFRRRRLHIAGA